MPEFSTEFKQTLRTFAAHHDNPFYWREQRIGLRSGEPWKTILGVATFLGFIFATMLGLFWFLLRYNVLSGITQNGKMPDWLGGQDGGRAVFAVLASCHMLYVYFTCRSLSSKTLSGEAFRGTLFQLLMAKIPALELVTMIMLYPMQQGFWMAIGGLPIYAVLMGFGSLGIHELIVLVAVLMSLSVSVPVWKDAAFTERTPEEVAELTRIRQKNAGCAATLIIFVLLPASVVIGEIFRVLHMAFPAFLSKLPSDVWPSLVAIPITFGWVMVRTLSAPFTWFGIPMPLWCVILPMTAALRLAKLISTSLFLRVSDARAIPGLPDHQRLRDFRIRLLQWTSLFSLGYAWDALRESDLAAKIFWPNAKLTPAEMASGACYILLFGCFVVSLFFSRQVSSKEEGLKFNAVIKGHLIYYAPVLLAIVSLLITDRASLFSHEFGTVISTMIPLILLYHVLAIRLGPGTTDLWYILMLVPLIVILLPFPMIGNLAAISPLSMAFVSNKFIQDYVASGKSFTSVPSPIFSLGIVAIFLLITEICRKRGIFQKMHEAEILSAQKQQQITMNQGAYRSQENLLVDPLEYVPGPAVSALRSIPLPESPKQTMPKESMEFDLTLQIAPPPVIVAPPPMVQQTQEVDYGEWRSKPMSRLGEMILELLTKRTDNPVALYSARRSLPGSLSADQLIVSLCAILFGLLVAYQFPIAFQLLLFPAPLSACLYGFLPSDVGPAIAVNRSDGLMLLVSTLFGFALMAPWTVCKSITESFRMERERSTLGFILLTPLSSVGVAVGHCVGAVLPSLTVWAGLTLAALVPTVLLCFQIPAYVALWAWVLGAVFSFSYLGLCLITGMWIGITEVQARDMTIGVYMLPLSFCVIAAGVSFYVWRYWNWGYYSIVAIFMSIVWLIAVMMWRNAIKEMQAMRIGDVPFEGRSFS